MEYTTEEYSKIGSRLRHTTRKQQVEYELVDIVGRGSCGAVYLAQMVNEPYTLFAVKTLAKNALRPQICEEISIHRMVSWHPSVVSLEFVIELENTIYIGLEYCKGGDLYDAITIGNITNCSEDEIEPDINDNKPTNRDELVRNLFLGILNATDFCHSRGVYHRDLKPENILLDQDCKIKIADFGLATRSIWSKEYGCGSCFYMAPEAHKPKNKNKTNMYYCTSAADIWSLGIIFLNLCFGRNPWKRASTEDQAFLEYIFNPNLLKEMFPLSDYGHKLVTKMLCINPLRRITINELIKEVKSIPYFIKKKQKDPVHYQTKKQANSIINNYKNDNMSMNEVIIKSTLSEMNQATPKIQVEKMIAEDSGISESDGTQIKSNEEGEEDFVTTLSGSPPVISSKKSSFDEIEIEKLSVEKRTENWIQQHSKINKLNLNINASDQSINAYWSCESAALSPV